MHASRCEALACTFVFSLTFGVYLTYVLVVYFKEEIFVL